eukprot:TRINITY_DN388_c0_g1_i6.p1 TRINITY_DN388_c0_g1~~TRINITY_DN388_c0_g1_i6.p1  ORF type:complete len:218 (-),score=49.74 TRINITY_DN388_c0_g1_i6:332-985(-)
MTFTRSGNALAGTVYSNVLATCLRLFGFYNPANFDIIFQFQFKDLNFEEFETCCKDRDFKFKEKASKDQQNQVHKVKNQLFKFIACEGGAAILKLVDEDSPNMYVVSRLVKAILGVEDVESKQQFIYMISIVRHFNKFGVKAKKGDITAKKVYVEVRSQFEMTFDELRANVIAADSKALDETTFENCVAAMKSRKRSNAAVPVVEKKKKVINTIDDI